MPPAPTPTPILEARGSWRAKGRIGEVQFKRGRPARPDWIKGDARAEWDRQVKQLDDAGILQKVDGAILACWCETWGEYVSAIRELAKLPAGGLLLKTAAGGFMPNPLVWIKNAAKRQLVTLAGQFGFTPAARTRIKSIEDGDNGEGEGPRLAAGTL